MVKDLWLVAVLMLIAISIVSNLAFAVAPPAMPTTLPAVEVTVNTAALPHSLGFHVIKSKGRIGDREFMLGVGVFLPPCYFKTKERLPIVMTLHNRGQSGCDGGQGATCEGLGMMMRTNWPDNRTSADLPANPITIRQDARFIGLAPQCPSGFTWASPGMAKLLCSFIDQIVQVYHADDDRVYLTGFSYGASSTWMISLAEPDRFAAIAVLDGRATSNPQRDMAKLKDVAIYLAVGDTDGPFDDAADRMHQALTNLPHPNFVWQIIKHGNHFSYYAVYRDPNFWQWLLAQRRHHPEPATAPVTTVGK